MLVPIGEHELLVFWVQLLVLVSVAHAFGWAMRRIGLPSVIGQLLAGLVLGPSIFGEIWPTGFDWFLPTSDGEIQSAALLAVAWIGIALLLVVTGFETDLALIRKLGRPAALVTAGSLLVPLAAGIGVGYLLPDAFVGDPTDRITFALFVALSLSVSSLAVVAKILSEMGLMRRDFGQITVAAGMANDVVGWMLLGVFTGLAAASATEGEGGGALDIVFTVVGMLVFVILAMTVGQHVVDWALRKVRSHGSNVSGALTIAIVCTLLFGVITQWLGVEAVLGAFVAGMVLHRSRFQQPEVFHRIEGLTLAFFAPVFFATAGLRLDLTTLNSGEALFWALVVIVAAIFFKFVGAYAGARQARLSHRAGLALGAGLNARGALEIVVGTVALTLGVFNTTSFTVIVLLPVVTSVFASVALRWIVRDFAGSEAEIARLEREDTLSRNLVVKNSRLLISSKGAAQSIAMAQLLHFAWPDEAQATVLCVGQPDADLSPLENVLHGRSVEVRHTDTADVVGAILAESQLGFGVIGMGAEVSESHGVISPLVDGVLSESPVPVVVVRQARNMDRPLPGAFSRALVPVGRSRASRAAQEIAFGLSANLGTQIQLAHVVPAPPRTLSRLLPFHMQQTDDVSAEVGARLLWQAVDQARELGVEAHANTLSGHGTADELLKFVDESGVDLVVLGAVLRRLDDRPSLGPTVERILDECDVTVAVVVVPVDL